MQEKGHSMTDRAFDVATSLIRNWQKTAIFIFLLILTFPMGLVGIMLAQQGGYVQNVYQAEHADLRKMILDAHQREERIDQQLKENRDLIGDGAYFQQRTCINTAKTKEERELCIRPRHWK